MIACITYLGPGFSKFNLKWGYRQLKLYPDSHNIATFATHNGFRRYKKLNFAMSAVSEIVKQKVQTFRRLTCKNVLYQFGAK